MVFDTIFFIRAFFLSIGIGDLVTGRLFRCVLSGYTIFIIISIEYGERVMKMSEWLSEEEQYKDTLNNEEISRIKDPELREIRQRHWAYEKKIYKDSSIADLELDRLVKIDWEKERKEILEYKKKHNKC